MGAGGELQEGGIKHPRAQRAELRWAQLTEQRAQGLELLGGHVGHVLALEEMAGGTQPFHISNDTYTVCQVIYCMLWIIAVERQV